jgi:hypothetical protein
MSSPVYISIIETTKLELAGAEQRLDLAKLAYKNFIDEHGILTDDGDVIYSPIPSPQMRMSLDDEKESLECELDEAHRRVAHCNEILSDLQLAAAVEADNVADLILGLPQTDEGDGAVEGDRK